MILPTADSLAYRAPANPELARAMADLRRSSAASPHTPKPRKGTRSVRKRAAIRAQRED